MIAKTWKTVISNLRFPFYLLHPQPSTANHNMQTNSSFSEHCNTQHKGNYSPTDTFLQNESRLAGLEGSSE